MDEALRVISPEGGNYVEIQRLIWFGGLNTILNIFRIRVNLRTYELPPYALEKTFRVEHSVACIPSFPEFFCHSIYTCWAIVQ